MYHIAGALVVAGIGVGAGTGMVTAGVLVTVVGILYLIPTFVAHDRGHHQRSAIAALNVLLGWTFLGWVGALVWSLTATPGRGRDAPPE